MDTRKDIILSFHRADRATAEWMFYQLRGAGYSVGMYLWNCHADFPFLSAMRRDAGHGKRILVLLSEDYLCEHLTLPDWIQAATETATEGKGVLSAVRINLSDMEMFLPNLPYLDLVGSSGQAARDLLLASLRGDAQQKGVASASIAETPQIASLLAEGKPFTYPFSTMTLTQLKAAGWRPERRFDASEYERLLQAQGYTVFPVVTEFLSRFGGLQIGRPSWRFPRCVQWFHFHVDRVLSQTFKSNIDFDMEDIGTPLCLIGDADESNRLPIVMDPMGNTYISDAGLHDLGVSGEDAIEALCTNRPIEGFEENHL